MPIQRIFYHSRAPKFLLITNLKAMHTSLATYFRTHAGRFPNLRLFNWADELLAEVDIADCFKVLVARNPYARVVSFYNEKLQSDPLTKLREERPELQDAQKMILSLLPGRAPDNGASQLRRLTSIPFSWLVQQLPFIAHRDGHLHPQTQILRCRNTTQSLHFDRVIHMEDLDGEVLLRNCNVDVEAFGVHNWTAHGSYEDYYTGGLFAVVNQVYHDDFRQLGYEMRW